MSEFSDIAGLQSVASGALGRSVLPGALTLVTADINKKLRLREMLFDVTQTTTTLPDGFLEAETIKVSGVVYLPSHETAQAQGAGGTYSVQGGTFLFNPIETAPDLAIRYYRRLDVLSGVETNSVLVSYPDVYLYGLLAHHAFLARDQAGAAAWGPLYQAAIDDAKLNDTMSRMSAVSMAAIPRAAS